MIHTGKLHLLQIAMEHRTLSVERHAPSGSPDEVLLVFETRNFLLVTFAKIFLETSVSAYWR